MTRCLKPSIDRIDDYEGYTFSTIQEDVLLEKFEEVKR